MENKEFDFKGFKMNGFLMLFLNIVLLFASVFLICLSDLWEIAAIVPGVLGFILSMIFCFGFMSQEPNVSRVMVFFGKYKGTIKDNGFFWVNPFFLKRKLTLRARNLDIEPIKVNDKRGNPVMIGLVVVWRITNTYKASFDIDNTSMINNAQTQTASVTNQAKMKAYENFVKIQSDAALRNVAGMYAYDHSGESESEELTLRSGGEEINDLLETQLNERLAIAGIEVVEARINYLAYAPEIAAVMLRRQQADAIISAREKIVDGAVGMVKMALDKLSEEQIVDLDDDKKAAMVSNLLVVLCSDEPAQPIVNSGTLYN